MVLGTFKRFAGSLFNRGGNSSQNRFNDSALTSFAATKNFLDKNPSGFGLGSSSLLRNAPRFGPEVYSPGFGDASGISLSDTFKLQGLSNDKDNRSSREKFSAGFDEGMSYADSFKKDNGDTRMAGQLFAPRGGGAGQLIPGFAIRDEKSLYPTGIIAGTKGSGGFNLGRAIVGGVKGFIGGGGPIGAAGGFVGGGFG